MTVFHSALLTAIVVSLTFSSFAQAAGVGISSIGIGARVSLGNLGRPTDDTFSGQPNFNGIVIGSIGTGARASLGAIGYSRPETTQTAGRATIGSICPGTIVSSNRNARTSIGGRNTYSATFGGIGK